MASSDLAVCLSAFGNGPAVEGGVLVEMEKDGTVTGCTPTQLSHIGLDPGLIDEHQPGGIQMAFKAKLEAAFNDNEAENEEEP
ncbi:MAG TPA: hypothetical protein VGM26_03785 [Rhizomicrobium sp.]|jgi:hypothetical protein